MSPLDPAEQQAAVAEDRAVARLLEDYIALRDVVLNLDPLTLPGARQLSPIGREALTTVIALYHATTPAEADR